MIEIGKARGSKELSINFTARDFSKNTDAKTLFETFGSILPESTYAELKNLFVGETANINPKLLVDRGLIGLTHYTKIQQVGVDVTIKTELNLVNNQFCIVRLNEQIEIPPDYFGIAISRSSFNRIGVLIRGTIWEPGYKGQGTLSVYNFSGRTIKINKNERIAQIIMVRADVADLYRGQFQNEGLILEKRNEK